MHRFLHRLGARIQIMISIQNKKEAICLFFVLNLVSGVIRINHKNACDFV